MLKLLLPPSLRTPLQAASLGLIIRLVSATCYTPSGIDRNDQLSVDWYEPTGLGSADDGFSMCCATHRSDPDSPRKDGLCDYSPGEVYRESCTDQTWESPNCIKLCVNGTEANGKARKNQDVHVTPCPDQSYCCGTNNTTCCDNGDGVWIRNGLSTKTNPNSTETNDPTQTTTAASYTTTGGPPLSTQTSPESTGLAGGAIAGIAIGSILGVAIIGVGLWFFFRKKWQRRTSENLHTKEYVKGPPDEKKFAVEKDGDLPELHDTARVSELEPGNTRVELPGKIPHRELE